MNSQPESACHGRAVRSARGGSAGATALGMLAVLFWSTTIPCSRSATEALGMFTTAAVVYLAAGVLGCGVLAVTGRLLPLLRQVNRRYFLGCGGLMILYTVLLYIAIGLARTREQIITVTVANYLWPSLTLLFSVPVLGWQARPKQLAAGTLLAWAGVGLAVGAGELGRAGPVDWAGHGIATVPALLAAVAWGLYSNLSRRWGSESETGAMPVFLLGAGVLLVGLRWCWKETPMWSGRVLWEAGYLAVFPTLLAYVCWDRAARRGDLSLVSAMSYLTPLFSVGVSGIYLGVAITSWQWLAGVLVVAGAVLCQRSMHHDPRMSR